MELVWLLTGAIALYWLDRYQDQIADRMAGEAFDQVSETRNGKTYSGKTAIIHRKKHIGHVFMPLFPSLDHDIKALCQTEDNHWFWYHAQIKNMKLVHTEINPVSIEAALEAMDEDETGTCREEKS